jgi:hypothetical protein
MPADDRRNRYDVIDLRRVFQTEQQPDAEHRKRA